MNKNFLMLDIRAYSPVELIDTTFSNKVLKKGQE